MRILIADDSNVSRHLLESIVKKWGYEVIATSDGNQAWEVLQRPDAPRLAILDWMMPGLTGPEVCRLVRESGSDPYTYILLLTSRTQKEDVIEGMTAGADDYIVKPFDRQELNVRLRAGRRIVDLQAALLEAQAALRYQATHDALTNVSNRAHIRQFLSAQVASGGPVGIIMLDIDRFKLVNDTYGHVAGDGVLVAAAERLSGLLTDNDRIGRYGGEEFLLVCRREPEDLAHFAECLRQGISSQPITVSGFDLTISASFGVAATDECPKIDEIALLKAADAALYEAKNSGRNCVRVAQSVCHSA